MIDCEMEWHLIAEDGIPTDQSAQYLIYTKYTYHYTFGDKVHYDIDHFTNGVFKKEDGTFSFDGIWNNGIVRKSEYAFGKVEHEAVAWCKVVCPLLDN